MDNTEKNRSVKKSTTHVVSAEEVEQLVRAFFDSLDDYDDTNEEREVNTNEKRNYQF